MSWLSWLWPSRRKAAPVAARSATPTSATALLSAAPLVPPPTDDSLRPVLPWLLGSAALTDTTLSKSEQAVLAALEQTLALPAIPDNLLPRAAALIPQLIALVRQTELPVPAIAERVGKDAVLAAELMSLASSAYYRAQGRVADLEQAITLVGSWGLQTVIARVLLKPIYQGSSGPWSARAAPRLWEHSEALARHAGTLAPAAGQAAFDGYLAGLLHDTGWTVALGVIDRAAIPLVASPCATFATALDERVRRLFGLAALRWDITPGFLALAQDARHNGLVGAKHPLAAVLQQAQRQCMDELSPAVSSVKRGVLMAASHDGD